MKEESLKMKLVVLDSYTLNPGDLSWDGLRAFGELRVYDRTSYTVDDPLIVQRIGDAQIVVTNKTPISQKTIEACPQLQAIAVVATGYNVVDVQAAREKGIPVMNVPAYGTQIVAQFALGLLLEITSHIGAHSESVHAGEWENCVDFCYWKYPMIELAGKTAGIVGLGRIGQQTAGILHAMGMNVLGYAPHRKDIPEAEVRQVSMEEIYAQSDVIFLTCPLFEDNREMIRKENIDKMKDGVILINTGRGGLIREQDLADALQSGKVLAAGLDVVSTEPIARDNPLLKAPNCIITPHIAWAAKEARQRIMDITIANIEGFLNGVRQNVVNL